MLARIQSYLTAPVFDEIDDNRLASFLNTVCWGVISVLLLEMVYSFTFDTSYRDAILSGVPSISFTANFILILLAWFVTRILHFGYVRQIGMVAMLLAWVNLSFRCVLVRARRQRAQGLRRRQFGRAGAGRPA